MLFGGERLLACFLQGVAQAIAAWIQLENQKLLSAVSDRHCLHAVMKFPSRVVDLGAGSKLSRSRGARPPELIRLLENVTKEWERDIAQSREPLGRGSDGSERSAGASA